MSLTYGSVCSGIEAATMAWHPLGWKPAFFSEIEKFPSNVLDHHYPTVPNLGDMTKFQEWPDHAIDLLVGGTPCQSFSIAGLRAGLADPRGNLMLTYLAIAARYQPRWLVWENVPGVLSSNGGRDFGTFLRGLAELGYGFAYRVLDAQFCRAYGYEWAVPQRRRRVFVVGYLGDWRRAAAVLFDGQSLRGDPAPCRQTGQRVAPTISARTKGGGGLGTDFDLDAGLIANSGDVGYCLTARGQQSLDAETETLLAQPIVMMERGRADGPSLETRQDGTANAILTPSGGRGGLGVGAIAFDTTQITSKANRSVPKMGDPCHPLAAGAHAPAIAWSIMPQNSGKDYKARPVEVAQPIMAGGPVGGNQGGDYIQQAWAVRRLTPTECERLQGFPDNFTAIPYRGKVAADGPRYKALGNSMAVNVMRVIGARIAMVDAIAEREAAA
ncbi:DNA cytosine methyltransferase [Devosia sp. MC1541]|uniref:DNA (cytosine-5-)-methyltransferase n=1 Tax=Devosia sp. MC1541 TaxID=2725264 RepID=UPI00145F0ADA|nr:DNA cytosine methyltransferase [Devosia sp. MC1541]